MSRKGTRRRETVPRGIGRCRVPLGGRGFTLLELLVVLAIVMIAAAIGFPALLKMQVRARIEGAAQGAVGILQKARIEAIKRSAPAVVVPRIVGDEHEIFAFVNVDGDSDLKYDPNPAATFGTADYEITTYTLPRGTQPELDVRLWGAADATPGGADAVADLTASVEYTYNVAVFEPNGSLRDIGGIRIGMGPPRTSGSAADDTSRNFLELRLEPAASGKIELLKWVPHSANADYYPRGAGGGYDWKWY